MDLRPLSYEEMCQMELLHAAANANMNGSSSSTGTGSSSTAAAGGATSASTTPTMLPIMVIPTAMMPPGTILTAAPAGAAAGGCDNGGGIGGNCEHFYQLQPTHILTAATPTSMSTQNAAGISMGMGLGCGVDGVSLGATPSNLLQAHNGPTLLNEQQAQQLLQQQQLPHQQIPQQHAANNAGTTVNILYTGTLTKPRTNTTATLTRKALESSTLPRGFQPSTFMVPSTSSANTTSTAATNADESDFEGSECGASVSTTTCIPHFRFGGCGMILQPATTAQQQQHHQHHQHEPQQVIGCGSLSHMMGSFAAAAGGAMHPGRFTAMGTGLSGTLGRNRRSASCTDGTTQTPPKRVSFKGDNLPPEELQVDEGANILRAGTAADAFNNCSYMHFDNFMDYQVSSSREFDGQPKKINVFGLERPIYEEQLKNPAMCIVSKNLL